MSHFGLVTLFPEMMQVLHYGITGRALEKGLIEITTWNPRDHSRDKYRRVDDVPYGGGPGMVLQAEPVCAAIHAAQQTLPHAPVIYLSPQGRRLDQAGVQELAQLKQCIFVAGRYEGIDERIIELEIDAEWSIGDYVISGGELAACVIIDAITRLLPGALGDDQSAQQDSYITGLLDYPHYTRPATVAGKTVPDVLLSGHHADIKRWRLQQSLGRSWLRRPDLLAQRELSPLEMELLDEFIKTIKADNCDDN